MSSQLLPVGCILPNPDIAGIGVRSSIYVQSFITTFMFFIFGLDNNITSKENRALHAVTVSTLMTACALLVSSFIQAGTIGMSAYHAQIVLNLSWINSTSLLHAAFSDAHAKRAGHPLKKKSTKSSEVSMDWTRSFILGSLHFCAMSALGLWLWIKGGKFGSQSDCNNGVFYVLFGHDIPFTSKGLKIVSLIIYGIASIPYFNTATFVIVMSVTTISVYGIFYLITKLLDTCTGSSNADKFDTNETKIITVSSTIVVVFLNLVFIIDNELMIRRSAALVTTGESEWTFGQTLALVLLALPAREIYKVLKETVGEEDTPAIVKPVETQEKTSMEIEPVEAKV